MYYIIFGSGFSTHLPLGVNQASLVIYRLNFVLVLLCNLTCTGTMYTTADWSSTLLRNITYVVSEYHQYWKERGEFADWKDGRWWGGWSWSPCTPKESWNQGCICSGLTEHPALPTEIRDFQVQLETCSLAFNCINHRLTSLRLRFRKTVITSWVLSQLGGAKLCRCCWQHCSCHLVTLSPIFMTSITGSFHPRLNNLDIGAPYNNRPAAEGRVRHVGYIWNGCLVRLALEIWRESCCWDQLFWSCRWSFWHLMRWNVSVIHP